MSSVYRDTTVTLTDDEKNILEQAIKVCEQIARDCNDEESCFSCGLKFQGVCPRLIKNVNGLRKERLLDCPLVEAIPKDQYEARLKADMVAMLTWLQLEIEEMDSGCGWEGYRPTAQVLELIQQKINDLAEGSADT